MYTKYEAVHRMDVSEDYASSGMLTTLIKVQTLSILSNIFACKVTQVRKHTSLNVGQGQVSLAVSVIR